MKIFGVFRGFPGLGRVVSGLSILTMLRKEGHEVKGYSYLQGVSALKDQNIDFIIEEQPSDHQIMALGLNPVGEASARLIESITKEAPDLVIIDGEPLLVSTLSMVYPREKILALLNPADLHNQSLPEASIAFFCSHYLAAGNAIVHGVNGADISIPDKYKNCNILKVNTILRESVLGIEVSYKDTIVIILGGGCSNSSESFYSSTADMGKKIIDAALSMTTEKFIIYCNDKKLADEINGYKTLDNLRIVSDYTRPEIMYKNAKMVICRAGRNTLSELLYLNIPAILMSTSGDFRSVEQGKNIDAVCALRPHRLIKASVNESTEQIVMKIINAISGIDDGFYFEPGNNKALTFIEHIMA